MGEVYWGKAVLCWTLRQPPSWQTVWVSLLVWRFSSAPDESSFLLLVKLECHAIGRVLGELDREGFMVQLKNARMSCNRRGESKDLRSAGVSVVIGRQQFCAAVL